MTAVTLAALLCGAACLLSARPDSCWPLGRKPRLGLLAATLVLVPFAAIGLLGSSALATSADAAAAGDWPRAEAQARRATSLAPWSSDPWRLLGEAQLAQGDLGGALASLERAIGKDPGEWALWLDLARTSEGPRRVQALARATHLNPRSSEIATFRAELDFEAPLRAASTEEETTK
jgi:Flp pilus assembly protein TadD